MTDQEKIAILLAACKLAVRYVAKMVADEVKTALPPEIALKQIEKAIEKAEDKKFIRKKEIK